MTTAIETTHKIIGLAAAGASMLGMRLDDALRLAPGQLEQHIATMRQLPQASATSQTAPACAPAFTAGPPPVSLESSTLKLSNN